MREQLIKYVELLFAGAPNSNEVKQEILQNTLDRFDDLISQGKSPEAAYRLAISGIGDISEILDGASTQEEVPQTDVSTEPVIQYTAPQATASHGKKGSSVLKVLIISIAVLLGLSILVGSVLAILFAVNGREFIAEITEDMNIEIGLGGVVLDGTTASTGSVSADAVDQIEIEWVAGSITIIPGDTETIDFSETPGLSTDDQMIWKQSGSKLQIQFCYPKDHSIGIGFNTELSKDLVITVPHDWFCVNLAIDAAAAEVHVQGLNINKVDFDGASGHCVLENCWIGDADLDTASGDILLSGGVMNVDCDAASASCTLILKNTPKSIEMDTASGDLDITFPEECGFTVSMDGISTQFNSDFPTTNKNGMFVYGDGGCRIEVDTVSGNVTIRQEE